MSPLAVALALGDARAAPPAQSPVPLDSASMDYVARLDAELGVPGGLTADAVASRAVETSFDVTARRADVLDAAANVDRALFAFIPRLSASARYARLSSVPAGSVGSVVASPGAAPGLLAPGAPLVSVPLSFPVILDQYTFQAGLSVPVSDYFLRFPAAHTAASQSRRAAEHTEAASRAKTATEARLAYYAWVDARLQVIVAEQALAQSEGHLDDVRRIEAAGNATPADVMAIEAQVAASRLLLEKSRSLSRIDEERVRIALHEPGRRELRVGEDVRADLPALDAGLTLDALYGRARVSRAELRAFDARVEALSNQAKVERAAMLPRLDAFADAQYANPNSRIFPLENEFHGTWDLGAQLTWTPSDIPGASASVQSVSARLARARAEQHALEDSIRAEVEEALEAVREADASVETAEVRLAAAGEAHRVRRSLFETGRATSLELSDSEGQLTQARLDALRAHVDQRVARARLAHAVSASPGA